MSQANETFFTAVGCMDGRVQDVVAKFGRQKFGALYPDTITEAGLVGLLGKESTLDPILKEYIRFKIIDVSIGKHHSQGIVVHGHQECAGNPVADEQHLDDIRRSVAFIKYLTENTMPVVGVFVKRDGEVWKAEEVSQTAAA